MKKLYAILPIVAAIMLIQAAGFEKKGSFDLELSGSRNLPAHTKLPPDSVRLTDLVPFGTHISLEHTKTPPVGSAVTIPLA